MKKFIKDHRRFLLTMVILIAIIAALGLKVVPQKRQVGELRANIESLEAELSVKKAEKEAAIAAMNAAKEANKTAKKAQSDAKKAADKLAKDLKAVQQEVQQNEAAQADSLTALNNALALLAQEAPVDQEQLMAELEAALTALGGTMPGTEMEGEGTEK